MRHWTRVVALAVSLLGSAGCVNSKPAEPPALSGEEEKEFERQQNEGRRGESRYHE